MNPIDQLFQNYVNWTNNLSLSGLTLILRVGLIAAIAQTFTGLSFAWGSRNSLLQIVLFGIGIYLGFLIDLSTMLYVSRIVKASLVTLCITMAAVTPITAPVMLTPYRGVQKIIRNVLLILISALALASCFAESDNLPASVRSVCRSSMPTTDFKTCFIS